MTPPDLASEIAAARLTPNQRAKLDDLAERMYQHVLRVIDLGRLYGVEQILWSELSQLGIEDLEGGLSTALLSEALRRVGSDPNRLFDTVPEGITPAEVLAVTYDDACLFCQHEKSELNPKTVCDSTADEAEWLASERVLQEMMADACVNWRREHAEALARFGLASRGARS